MRFLGWIPIGLSPPQWEGKPVLWRDSPRAPFVIRRVPPGFSRELRHCGQTEVAGVVDGEPLANIPDYIATLTANLKRLADCLDVFIRESSDPGVEALAAVYEARRILSATGGEP